MLRQIGKLVVQARVLALKPRWRPASKLAWSLNVKYRGTQFTSCSLPCRTRKRPSLALPRVLPKADTPCLRTWYGGDWQPDCVISMPCINYWGRLDAVWQHRSADCPGRHRRKPCQRRQPPIAPNSRRLSYRWRRLLPKPPRMPVSLPSVLGRPWSCEKYGMGRSKKQIITPPAPASDFSVGTNGQPG